MDRFFPAQIATEIIGLALFTGLLSWLSIRAGLPAGSPAFLVHPG